MIEHFINKNGKKIGDIVFYTIMAVILAVILSLFITDKTTGKANVFGYKPFFIMSGSMEPVIKTHQVVLAKTVGADGVKVGDIVAYEQHSVDTNVDVKKTIIHRIVAINDDGTFVFKGDNNDYRDPYDVSSNAIMYKVVLY